jgi:hypothetical protein
MNTEVEVIAEAAKVVWYNQPLVVALVGGTVVAVISLVANRYAIRPKHCSLQVQKCREMFQEEVQHVKNEFVKDVDNIGKEMNNVKQVICREIEAVKATIKDDKKVSHEVFARKDVINPQMHRASIELLYIRKRLDQLADDRRLPPVDLEIEKEM